MELQDLEYENVRGITGNKQIGYTIQEPKKFSEVVVDDEIVIAYRDESDETFKSGKIFIYRKNDLKCLSKKGSYEFRTKKYNINKTIFWSFGTNNIMLYDNGEVKWIELPMEYRSEGGVIFEWFYMEAIFFCRGKFFAICKYQFCLDRSITLYKSVLYEINPYDCKSKAVFGFSNERNYDQDYYFVSGRTEYPFRFFTRRSQELIFDLFTGFTYKMDNIKLTENLLENLEVCYSSKDRIIILNKKCMRYYLYIKGKCVYKYTAAVEHKKVMFDLKNNLKISKNFSALPVGDNLCIWSETMEPELISLNFKKVIE